MSIRLFCGYDKRESVGFHVFAHSVIRSASLDVSFHALDQTGLREGSNAFTLSRFLVPWLMSGQHNSFAIFADASDMLMMGDITDLAELFDSRYAVQVVKHDYTTRNPRKYIGTAMECENRDYERKNWASLMLVNTQHPAWRLITYDYLRSAPIKETLQLSFLRDEWIGELPPAWNVLADEGQSVDNAKILHWTAGIPAFDHYKTAPGAEHWHAARHEMLRAG